MGKKRKRKRSGNEKKTLEIILLITAILDLIEVVTRLVEHLLE